MTRYSRLPLALAVLFATAALGLLAAPGQAQDEGGTDALRIGWAQEPQTLNPFVGQDEENFNVWSLTWDLLVNFNPEDLSTTPGIATDWEVAEDEKSVTFELDPDRVWSDGEPITSEDVKWSLENLGSEGDIFAGYTDGITKIKTPDDYTVVLETKEPDARLIGGLFVYILPEHVWGKVDLDELTGTYQPKIPMVGSGPYIVTEFERDRIITMERNPEWQGDEPGFDEVQYIKYGSQDAVERALTLGEIDMVVEVEESTFGRIGEDPNIETLSSPNPSYTQLAFNLCSEEDCPDAVVQPGGPGARGPAGDRLRGRPQSHQRHRRQGNGVRGERRPALVLQAVLHRARAALSVRPGAREPDPRRRRLGRQRRRAAHEGRHDALVRPLRPLGVQLQRPGRTPGRGDGG